MAQNVDSLMDQNDQQEKNQIKDHQMSQNNVHLQDKNQLYQEKVIYYLCILQLCNLQIIFSKYFL